MVNTGGTVTNAYQATLQYPTDKVQAISASKGGSICALWVKDPSYSNGSGTANFECGTPSNYNGSSGTIGSVTFRAVNTGTATISVGTPAQVLAADGMGSNVLGSRGSVSIAITDPPRGGPSITSATHPDPEAWYKENTVELSWSSTGEDLGYSTAFDQAAGTIPGEAQNTTGTSKTESNVGDGVWYFHIRTRLASTWSGASHYKVQIDKTPPEEFNITVEPEGISDIPNPKIYFETTDNASGVSRYEVSIGDGEFTEAQSPFELPNLSSGTHIVTVKAIDNAGNETYAKTDVRIKEVASPTITLSTNEILFGEEVVVTGKTIPGGKVQLYIDSTSNPLTELLADDSGEFTYTIKSFALVPWEHKILASVTETSTGLSSIATESETITVILASIRLGNFVIPWWMIVVGVGVLAALLLAILMWLFFATKRHRHKMGGKLQHLQTEVQQDFTQLENEVKQQIAEPSIAQKIQAELEAEAQKINTEIEGMKKIEHAKNGSADKKSKKKAKEDTTAPAPVATPTQPAAVSNITFQQQPAPQTPIQQVQTPSPQSVPQAQAQTTAQRPPVNQPLPKQAQPKTATPTPTPVQKPLPAQPLPTSAPVPQPQPVYQQQTQASVTPQQQAPPQPMPNVQQPPQPQTPTPQPNPVKPAMPNVNTSLNAFGASNPAPLQQPAVPTAPAPTQNTQPAPPEDEIEPNAGGSTPALPR
jgi:hypothetical protein